MNAIFYLIFLFPIMLYGQKDKYWYPFEIDDSINNPLSSSLGFKDFYGKIKIEPVYVSPLTQNKRFEKIVALTEYSNNRSKSFYLNKHGRKFGIDSVYTFDFMHDTEQEGFIRFSTGRYLDSIGLFNANGDIMIEPKYNSLSRANNGLVIAKIGAIRKHEDHQGACDHWSFVGGRQMILDTSGNVLIDNFEDGDIQLNLYSLSISNSKSKEKFRHHFEGVNGKYYSFISFKEEFEHFVFNVFLKGIAQRNIDKYLFSNLKLKAAGASKKELFKIIDFLNSNKIEIDNATYFFLNEEDEGQLKAFENYVNNSNDIIIEKYPIFEIRSQNNSNSKNVTLSFIRTENGYKIYDFKINGPN